MTDTPKTSEAAGTLSNNWEATAERLFNCSQALERENAKLRELGNELRKSADMIGFVQSADTYRDSVRRIKAWDDFLANVPSQPRGE